MFYSASTGGFYHPEIHPDRPADAVAITAEAHRRLLDGQSAGRAIVAGGDGRPKLAPLHRATVAELRTRAIDAVKAEAARRIDAVAPIWRQLNALRAGAPDPMFARIDAVRAASTAIEATIAALDRDALTVFDVTALWPS